MSRKYYYRASSMGNLMTEARAKGETMGETAKKALANVYAFSTTGISKSIESKYFEKGHKREELGITYLSLHTKKFYKKNEERIKSSEGITGLPDLYEGESIYEAEAVIDIKNSWSYVTFLEAKTEALAKDRIWQGHTYNFLTGAKRCDFAIVCTNAPMEMIFDEKKRAFYKLNQPEEDDPAYILKCLEIERNMIVDMKEFLKEYPYAELETLRQKKDKDFVSVPREHRIFIKSVPRDEVAIQSMLLKVPEWDRYIEETFEMK
jgi:hypothetical protein